MNYWPKISELAEQVNQKKVSAVSLVEKSLKIIKEKSEFDAIISVIEDRALKRAKLIDQKIAKGQKQGKLAGVPFIAKDNLLTFGCETTAASNILRGFNAPYQATVIDLLEAEGGICVAKANLDAFAHGTSTENSDFMVTKNPHDKSRVAGGSSGGPAAAVVLNMTPFAIGTDTGGSIRQPASLCGAVGFKPTYGLVSRNGVIAMASSTDVIGPITSNVEDCSYVLDIMASRDPLDSTTINRDKTSYKAKQINIKGKKIGIIKEINQNDISKEAIEQFEKTIENLKAAGVIVKQVSVPLVNYSLACYYVLCPAEVSSNLGRYDGVRYGFFSKNVKDLEDSYKAARSIGFGKEAKRRIMIGTYVLSSGYYDAYYKQAQKLRTKLIDEFNTAFEECDFILTPTAPDVAFAIGQKIGDPLKMYMNDVLTVQANLVGIPAISIPMNVGNKLPLGLQIMAKQNHDTQVLDFALSIEGLI
ncbi:MAG TPA: Asp-tRNA(Asn)/Glu-tRNA(Gln) amidotransferase subunit GatA [Candidatus Saccharimonadia bacterium]|nr:Asp-tRNA(Asn)/Glu-tRNA(Gln) amidotransferase subunit GatA [Candidatus Saccharimonadia bacterium]